MIELEFDNYTIAGTNEQELKGIFKEIFKEHIYYFETENPSPRILDVGAHVGIASLYFKKIYPQARITAVEPLPATFALLQKNLDTNQITDIETIQAALGKSQGETTFYFDSTEDSWYSTASIIPGAWNKHQQSQSITVPTIGLSTLLTQPVDLLKMDIEGSEEEVLLATTDPLRSIKHLILEYHPVSRDSKTKIVKHLSNFRLKLIDDSRYTQVGKRKLLVLEFRNKD